ncbi:MAG: hypothetical protein R3B09_22750 [Nannocystaceae bacterium]
MTAGLLSVLVVAALHPTDVPGTAPGPDAEAPRAASAPPTEVEATPAASTPEEDDDAAPAAAGRRRDPDPNPSAVRPPPPPLRYRPEDEHSARRRGFGYRGATVGLVGQVVWGRFVACPYFEGDVDCTGAPTYLRAQGTPTIDLLAEFGHRWARFALGVYTSPVGMGFEDWGTAILFGVRAGALIGNEKVRAGATAGGGYLGWQAHGHLFVTPWRTAKGTRLGLAIGAGAWNWLPSVTLGLRIAPPAMNHRGGRRAARERARAEASRSPL